MERMIRKPFQGVTNIIRFNWHFYAVYLIGLLFLWSAFYFLPVAFHLYIQLAIFLATFSTTSTLVISYYIYDLSNLYTFQWLDFLDIPKQSSLINIHAGFDETSAIILQKFNPHIFRVFDFYDPKKHTEVSIKRARKAYPAFPNTRPINTQNIPLTEKSTDVAFLLLAAHEIRDQQERIDFFMELKRVMKNNGKVIVVEHLRDMANFMAYNIGFLHFIAKKNWLQTFRESNWKIEKEFKITPFITVFILEN